MILPGEEKTALSLRNCCGLARQRPGNIFNRIGARGAREGDEKNHEQQTQGKPAARAQRGQFLLGGHVVTG